MGQAVGLRSTYGCIGKVDGAERIVLIVFRIACRLDARGGKMSCKVSVLT